MAEDKKSMDESKAQIENSEVTCETQKENCIPPGDTKNPTDVLPQSETQNTPGNTIENIVGNTTNNTTTNTTDNTTTNTTDNTATNTTDNTANNTTENKTDNSTESTAENATDNTSETPNKETSSKTVNLIKYIRLLLTLGFIIFTALFINEVFIQPYRTNKVIQEAQELYNPQPSISDKGNLPTTTPGSVSGAANIINNKPAYNVNLDLMYANSKDPNRDNRGRLLQFRDVLEANEDVKGWITIADTVINYPVLQSSEDDPEYYLTRNIKRQKDKAGSLFLDMQSSVEENTKNLVIHGHNMKSTQNMFHELELYKKLDFYKERPTISFDTIFETGKWKIFSIIITNGSSKKEPFFDYTRSHFNDDTDFLKFVYELRIRSKFDIDVDINENDQLLTLSTCTYELNDYRLIIVARRVREGEDPSVDVNAVKRNPNTLYPLSWYDNYNKEVPEIKTFEESLEEGSITWYHPAK